jgi:hypothetical protein
MYYVMLPVAITSHLVSGLPKFIFFVDLYSMFSRHLKHSFSSSYRTEWSSTCIIANFLACQQAMCPLVGLYFSLVSGQVLIRYTPTVFAGSDFNNFGNLGKLENFFGLILKKQCIVSWHFNVVFGKPRHFRILMELFTYYRTRSTHSVLGMLGGGRRIRAN